MAYGRMVRRRRYGYGQSGMRRRTSYRTGFKRRVPSMGRMVRRRLGVPAFRKLRLVVRKRF